MLVSAKDILMDAHNKKYAVGAFNTSNLEFTKAIVEAAEELNAPIIIQTSQGAISYAGVYELWAIVTTIANRCKVPVALHLDHGTDFDIVMSVLRTGWTSVMFDASKFSYEENVAMTKMIVQIARPMGVQVEAELGKIGGVEEHVSVDEREATMTDPEEALDFVQKTNVDSLAIAVGTAHGIYKGEPKLDFERVQKIKEKINIPLVLHGGSGVPEEAIKEAVRLGLNKINIDTELRLAFKKGIKEALEKDPENYDPRKLLTPGMKEIKEIVKNKIQLFGSEGRASITHN